MAGASPGAGLPAHIRRLSGLSIRNDLSGLSIALIARILITATRPLSLISQEFHNARLTQPGRDFFEELKTLDQGDAESVAALNQIPRATVVWPTRLASTNKRNV
jgi:hypothetical protein